MERRLSVEAEWHGVLLQREELNSSWVRSTDMLADAAREAGLEF